MNRKNIIHGFAGSILLLSLYFAVLTIFNGFDHAVAQFTEIWYLVITLAAGFGIQIGLFSYTRHRMKTSLSKKEVAATSATSTGSMVACCAHHIADILPVIGLSGALLFMADYMSFFLVLGIMSNIIGITMMLGIIQKHKLYDRSGLIAGIMKFDMKTARDAALVFSVVFLVMMIFNLDLFYSSAATAKQISVGLNPQTNEANGLSVEATPVLNGEKVEFNIALNTHQGDLNYDMTKISTLEDDGKKSYKPVAWNGPIGGHHISGTLVFRGVQKTESIKLTLKNMYGSDRVFEWSLR